MRIRLRDYIVLLLFGVLCTCASGRLIINPDYRSGVIIGETLAVVIKDPRPLIAYDGNVVPEFGKGNQDSLIYSFFKTQLLKDLRKLTNFRQIKFDKCSSQCLYDNQIIKSKPPLVEIQVPVNGAAFHCDCGNPDFVLFIDELSIGTSSRFDINPMMGIANGGYYAEKKLSYASKIILWDIAAKKNVLYGYVEATTAVLYIPVITITQWKEVSDSYVREIFSGTALRKAPK